MISGSDQSKCSRTFPKKMFVLKVRSAEDAT